MKIKHLFAVIITAAALYSCGSVTDISYFQDIPSATTIQMAEAQQIKLQPTDKISIVVNTQDPNLTQLFNLPTVTRYVGATTNYSQNQYASLYSIDNNGDIDFPVLGKIQVAGMTRAEVAAKIKNELNSQNLVKDPTVTVEFQNLAISVLGEVKNPGRYSIDRDRYTIIDAIAQAGDLTVNGIRKNVTVLRTVGNEQRVYKLDLCSDSSLVHSPAYYLQQGDCIYVEPNEKKARESTVNGNNVLSTSFWLSVTSVLTSVAVLIVNIID